MTVDLISIYKEILSAQGIRFQLLQKSGNDLEKTDYGFRKRLFKDYDYNDYFGMLLRNSKEIKLYFYRDDFLLNYCFFEFPEELKEQYEAEYALIGPVIFGLVQESDISRIMKEHNLPVALTKDFSEFYNRVPTLPTHDFWVSLITPLIKTLFGNYNDYRFIDLYSVMNSTEQDAAIDLNAFDNSTSFEAIADRYDAEDRVLDAVAMGNVNDAIAYYRLFRQFNIAPRTPNEVRNHKNWMIILNTKLRVAVRRAKVHPYYIDELSRSFAISIENTNNTIQLQNLATTMLRKYAMLVSNHSTRDYSALIAKCTDQINLRYQEKLSLETLADFCNVTPGYLSAQFRKETGMTLTDYIHSVRIRRATLLLNSTDNTIQEIAEQCGFTDSNYFTRVFKKQKGISPVEYRKKIGNKK
ncbi:MAG: AraC family transcriptional regulator [Oribacterium sp.]|nr:AraC family transcriptional regulator [Oribacterium sp.]